MNVKRLFEIARIIEDDLKDTETVDLLNSLTAALQNQINDPGNSNHQTQVSEFRKKIMNNLGNSKSNQSAPGWKQLTREIGADGLLGNKLAEEIHETFSQNGITPSIALEKLKEIQQKLQNLKDNLDKLTSSLSHFQIHPDKLEPGECELDITIPRDFINHQLKDLGKELTQLEKHFGVFSELATGSREGFKIRTISSSDFIIVLLASMPTIYLIAKTIDTITATYEKVLKIRIARQELKDSGIPERTLTSIKSDVETLVSTEIEKIKNELFKMSNTPPNDERKNELEKELTSSLREIANRIDRGLKVEIRVEPLLPPAEGEKTTRESPKIKKHREQLNLIQESADKIRFFEKSNAEPILGLPDLSNNKTKNNRGSRASTKKTTKKKTTKKTIGKTRRN